jgi:hypothetical protein
MTTSTSERAAQWWGEKVFGKTLDQKITRRDGTDKESEATEAMLNLFLGSFRGNPDSSKKEAFVTSLAELIQKEVDKTGMCRMYVDYDPEGVLRIVAQEFDVGYGQMPFKTGMDVTKYMISVKEGYGANYVTLPE